MAKKKKEKGEGFVAKMLDKVTHAHPDEKSKEAPQRDLSDANAGIKDHAKFDKFKQGDEINGN